MDAAEASIEVAHAAMATTAERIPRMNIIRGQGCECENRSKGKRERDGGEE